MTDITVVVEVDQNHRIELRCLICGTGDLSVTICGGDRPHVGAVALGCPKQKDDGLPGSTATVSSICALGHRDDEIARRTARYIASEIGCTVSVCAGVHVDAANSCELALLIEKCDEACRRLVAKLRKEA